jgi:glycine/D-amino acid oxidase-like deaminating enzyme
VAIHTNRGNLSVDSTTPVIVAAGSWTPKILRKLDVFVPLYPLKGYNLMFKVPENSSRDDVPKRIVADAYM